MPVATLIRTRVVEVPLALPTLPAPLDGLRIVQLTDLHCGRFAPERRVDEWVDQANALQPDLIALTGDFIAWGPTYVEPVARSLGRLRARRGVFACMGNHDYFGAGEPLVRALEGHGITVLRNRWQALGDGVIVAGVDDQWTRRHDLDAALRGIPADAFTLLLCHDPKLFPDIAGAGVPLTLSGHTHAGQLAVPFMPHLNLAALIGRYTSGIYREGDSTLYVGAGLGTTGPPVRIGTRSELPLFTLRRLPRR